MIQLSTTSVVLNLFVTADRSTFDNFTAAREYPMLVVIFQLK